VPLNVYSEIGRLREVIVHAPGREVDCMPPELMRQLLFDDIIHGARARQEHGQFVAILEAWGVSALDVQDLLRQAIDASGDGGRGLVDEVGDLEDVDPAAIEDLRALDSPALAAALVEGLIAPPEVMEPDYLFRLPPLPNLIFSRDAQAVIGDGVVIAAMSSRARQREPLLGRYVFRNHPRLRTERILADFLVRRPGRGNRPAFKPTLEGGDVLVFEEGVVLVGVSERTTERAVDILAERLRALETFHTLILVPLPRSRSVMHLDTIFTRISADECLVHAPMVLPDGPETLSVIRIDLRQPGDWGRRHPSLLDALRTLGIDLRPITCGGAGDYIRQAREQWTDGANSFAVAPGVLLLYSRNEGTAAELARSGYEVLAASELEYAPDGRCVHRFAEGRKYAILLPSEELSRARGGPRCMTMPLVRDGAAG